MENCNSDTLLKNLVADCVAVKRAGGVKATIYATRVSNIAGMVVNGTSGALTTLTLEAGAKFLKLEGRKFSNTAGTTYSRSENGPSLRQQSATFRAYVATPAQRSAVDALLDQEDMVLFVPTNGSQVKVYGYSLAPHESTGLAVTDGGESDGTALADDTSFTLTFTGAEMNLPPIYEETGGFGATLDYLDALVTP
jgi:hypothetical protein